MTLIYRSLQASLKHSTAAAADAVEEVEPATQGPRIVCTRVEGAALLNEL